ncbi:MAG: hypothetical protein A2147_02460 [Chloroflexi bacterium RBG_16_57_8]|nr:MAG: hypothetical protein A2147_02460 [Chloroflexi bacterium RBG_16_57_8]
MVTTKTVWNHSMPNLRAHARLIRLEATSPMSGGILYFLGGYFVRFVRTLLLLSIWRAVFAQAGDGTASLDEVLRYTLVAAILWQQVDVQTTASVTFWEGTASSRFLRPLSVFGQYISETIGRWVPGLIFLSIPLALLSPVLGVDIMPTSSTTLFLFMVSLLIGILSGFAMDFILTGYIMVYLGNANYIASQIRAAFTMLLSGALIPLHLLPFGIGQALQWLPFATMASAPLSLYVGIAEDVGRMLLLQVSWCILLWLAAVYVWKKNRQRLVVLGG